MAASMKVTVCFDHVRVVVPCGSGELSVTALIQLAVARYRKAIGKTNDYWVTVHSLKSLDGGILDQDDRIVDVVDDREQIIAIFEEQDGRRQQPNGGDGTSASSVGTSSPDIFQNVNCGYPMQCPAAVDITSDQLRYPQSALVSRCGSEPILKKSPPDVSDVMKNFAKLSTDDINNNDLKPPSNDGCRDDVIPSEDSEFHAFTRASARKSLTNNAAMMRWLEAQERLIERNADKDACGRSEPVGSSDHADPDEQYPTMIEHLDDEEDEIIPQSAVNSVGSMITLENDGSPLGIHVVPGVDVAGRNVGLVIQSIEPNGRVHRDGRLRTKDRIIAINGTSLVGIDFYRAQDIFKEALQSPVTQLQVVFADVVALPPPLPSHPPPPSYTAPTRKPLPELPGNCCDDDDPTYGEPNTSTPAGKESEADTGAATDTGSLVTGSKLAAPSLPRSESNAALSVSKMPPLPSPMLMSRQQQQQLLLLQQNRLLTPSRSVGALDQPPFGAASTTGGKFKFIPINNTRAIGRKLHIQLVKGNQGLGFSVTTRDNQSGDNCPIYIKNILPQGAAVVDGRLQPGDRLLEVNGITMYGKTQEYVVNYLRHLQLGSVVDLIISRPDFDDNDNPLLATPSGSLPGINGNVPFGVNDLAYGTDSEVMVFIITLGETGTESGLGISVKGKTTVSDAGNKDLGLFVKAVVEGGAAAKDGRLRADDQLLEINGVSLLGLTNVNAMETLRHAMQKDESNSITLVIARPKPSARLAVRMPQAPTEPASVRKPTAANLMPPPSTTKVLSTRKRQIPDPSTVETQQPAVSSSAATDDASAAAAPSTLSSVGIGAGSGSAFRNVSYQRATHESILGENGSSPASKRAATAAVSAARIQPSINAVSDGSGSGLREPQTVGTGAASLNSDETKVIGRGALASAASCSTVKTPVSQSKAAAATDSDNEPTPTHWDPSLASMLTVTSPADTDPAKIFSRDGFGRKSVSEKRKTLVNPRLVSFYQQTQSSSQTSAGNSTLKRVQSAESLLSQTTITSPKFNRREIVRESLKKCSSLESLNTTDRGQPSDKFNGGNFSRVQAPSYRRNTADNMEPVEEEDADFRYPGPAPSTDKKSKEKGFFKALFRIGKSKKEAKTPAPKQVPVESLKDDDRRDNARTKSQYGRSYDRETADQELAAMNARDRQKKASAAIRSRSDANPSKRPRSAVGRCDDDDAVDSAATHVHYSNDDLYCPQMDDRCCQVMTHSSGYCRDCASGSVDHHFDRPGDRHSAYCADQVDYCSLYQNYREMLQQPPSSVLRHNHRHHHRYESYAEPVPPYSSSGPYYRSCPPPPDATPGGGACSCSRCYASTFDEQPPPSYHEPYLQYYVPPPVAPDQYDRLPVRYVSGSGVSRGTSVVQQTPMLSTRRPRASSPPGSTGVRAAPPPPRSKTPFAGADERRPAPTPMAHHRHQPSDASCWQVPVRDRCYSAYDEPRRPAYPTVYSAGGRDDVGGVYGGLPSRRRADTLSAAEEAMAARGLVTDHARM